MTGFLSPLLRCKLKLVAAVQYRLIVVFHQQCQQKLIQIVELSEHNERSSEQRVTVHLSRVIAERAEYSLEISTACSERLADCGRSAAVASVYDRVRHQQV